MILKRLNKNIGIALLLLSGCYACNNNNSFIIEPVDAEFNARLLTGKDLNPALFSTTDVVQYYQVDNFSELKSAGLKLKLDSFADKKYNLNALPKIRQLSLLFYQKKRFTKYTDHLYENARDNENGTLDGYKSDLKARIDFYKSDTAIARHTTIYNGDYAPQTTTDTIPLKN